MKKINILKKNLEFTRIINTYNSKKIGDYVIYIEYETNDIYHFGISVSKKIGNAVTRNKIKRQIKSILDNYNYKNNFNCIIIVRKSILNHSFSKMKEDLEKIILNLNILKEKNYEKEK